MCEKTKKTCDAKTDEVIKLAISEIREEKASFIVIKNEKIIYRAQGPGVKPIIELHESVRGREFLRDSIVVDKIIGKAAAMILDLGKVSKIHGVIMSKAAQRYLDSTDIEYSCDEQVEVIQNRAGDGVCPIESSVLDISSPEQGYIEIKKVIDRLMSGVASNE